MYQQRYLIWGILHYLIQWHATAASVAFVKRLIFPQRRVSPLGASPYREMKGLLQADVAEKLGVSRSYYGHIESGNREIYFTLAINICRVLDLDMNDFMKNLK